MRLQLLLHNLGHARHAHERRLRHEHHLRCNAGGCLTALFGPVTATHGCAVVTSTAGRALWNQSINDTVKLSIGIRDAIPVGV